MRIVRETWQGMDAVRMTGGGYEAVILPEFGANCVSLTHLKSGIAMLRTPRDHQEMQAGPNVYGLPILFPPNRIRDGVYCFDGRKYVFPINEPARHHHIHGFLSATAFSECADGVFEYRATREMPYLNFPHAFTMRRSYRLDERGMTHTIEVVNDSDTRMPLGIGVHAAWNVPQADWQLHIPVRRRWLLDERILPTGESVEHDALTDAMRAGTLCPEETAMSCLLETENGEISLVGEHHAIVCDMDARFRFVMMWNGGGGQRFVCPEPQTWMVDAPNLSLPAEITGFDALEPSERRVYELHYALIER